MSTQTSTDDDRPTLPKPSKKSSSASTTEGDTEEPTPTEQFIFDQVKERYNYEYTRLAALDGKANNLLGLIGIILSIVLAGNGILFSDITSPDTPVRVTQNELRILTVILVFLVIALGLGCGSLWLRSYDRVPNAEYLLKTFAKSSKRKVVKKSTASIVAAIKTNKFNNDLKGYFIIAMLVMFFIGMIFAAIFIFSISSKFLP
jgi:hypothetical protein